MPTGYTAGISNGITFQKFAMNCARAFGALIEMRDSPSDAPIPENFKKSDYHEKEIAKCKKLLAELERMDSPKARKLFDDERKESEEHARKYEIEKLELRQKYEAMLREVKKWNPPTSEHNGLKDFMLKQISESIDFDCGPSYRVAQQNPDFEKWFIAKKKEVITEIQRHTEEDEKEAERTASRNKWVRELRESLSHV